MIKASRGRWKRPFEFHILSIDIPNPVGTTLARDRRVIRKVPMKRYVIAALSIFAVAATVGWQLASHPEASVELQEISLIQNSEHSQPGPTNALAGIRIRLSPSDFGYDIGATADAVPQISLAAK
jgi:hypothetical protein